MRKWLATMIVVTLLATSVPLAAQENAQIVNSPNVLGWPVTTTLQKIDFTDTGVRVTFDKCAVWPDVTPPGWAGPLRFTLWLFEDIGGQWYGSGIIQFWACDQLNGGAIYEDNQIARNWVYDKRWGPMVGHQPAPGEVIGFMVSAGNARGQEDHLVTERSNIVRVSMPTHAESWPLGAVVIVPPDPAPAPLPIPVPIPAPQPVPLPSTDLTPLLQGQLLIRAQIAGVSADVAALKLDVDAFHAEVRNTWQAVFEPVVKYVLPAVAMFFAGKKAAQ